MEIALSKIETVNVVIFLTVCSVAAMLLCLAIGAMIKKFNIIMMTLVFALISLLFATLYLDLTKEFTICHTCQTTYDIEYRYCPMDGSLLEIEQ